MASSWIRLFVCNECGEASLTGRIEWNFEAPDDAEAAISSCESAVLGGRFRVTRGICWVCLASQAPANDSD